MKLSLTPLQEKILDFLKKLVFSVAYLLLTFVVCLPVFYLFYSLTTGETRNYALFLISSLAGSLLGTSVSIASKMLYEEKQPTLRDIRDFLLKTILCVIAACLIFFFFFRIRVLTSVTDFMFLFTLFGLMVPFLFSA